MIELFGQQFQRGRTVAIGDTLAGETVWFNLSHVVSIHKVGRVFEMVHSRKGDPVYIDQDDLPILNQEALWE